MAKKLPIYMYDSHPKLYNNFYESLDGGSYFKNPAHGLVHRTFYASDLKHGSKLYMLHLHNCHYASNLKLSNKSINKMMISLG